VTAIAVGEVAAEAAFDTAAFDTAAFSTAAFASATTAAANVVARGFGVAFFRARGFFVAPRAFRFAFPPALGARGTRFLFFFAGAERERALACPPACNSSRDQASAPPRPARIGSGEIRDRCIWCIAISIAASDAARVPMQDMCIIGKCGGFASH
jgi:hypothetical protein